MVSHEFIFYFSVTIIYAIHGLVQHLVQRLVVTAFDCCTSDRVRSLLIANVLYGLWVFSVGGICVRAMSLLI